MSDNKRKPQHMISLEEWKATMLAKGEARRQRTALLHLQDATRFAISVRRLRLRLGCWVAGRDLDNW